MQVLLYTNITIRCFSDAFSIYFTMISIKYSLNSYLGTFLKGDRTSFVVVNCKLTKHWRLLSFVYGKVL